MAEFQADGQLLLNLLVRGRKFKSFTPFFNGVRVLFLAVVDIGFQLVLLQRGRQLTEASEGLESQLIVGTRAPIMRLGSIRSLGGRQQLRELSFPELALECGGTAIRLWKTDFLLLFNVCPVEMLSLTIDLRHRPVHSSHRRRFF